MERISRKAWQLKPQQLLITAGTYDEFDHPVEISDVTEMGPSVRVDLNGRQAITFLRDDEVFIVDTFKSPNVTAETKECADCGNAMPKDSIHTECRTCRKRPFS